MFEPINPSSRYRLRNHRLDSKSLHLTQAELVEIRASQRTFEGAYFRTALSLFSFALIILKIFTREFYPIGVLFAVYGALVLVIAGYRRAEGNRQFFVTEVVVQQDDSSDEDGDGEGAGTSTGVAAQQPPLRRTQSKPIHKRKFRTSGNVVIIVGVTTVTAYAMLLWLIFRLKET